MPSNHRQKLITLRALTILAAVCVLLLQFPLPLAQAQSTGVESNARVIVKYKAESSLLRQKAASADAQHALQAQALGARVGLALGSGAGVGERAQVIIAKGMTSEQLAQRLAAESDIEYAVPDQRRRHTSVPNDPLYLAGPPLTATTGGPVVGQWYLHAPAGEVQASINVEPAWDLAAGGSNIVVAVIDTGVRFDHPDLRRVATGGNLLPGYDMISDPAVANDGDGRDADASDPGDWVSLADIRDPKSPLYQCSTTAEDSSWHGTQTSGLIAALSNNGVGMAGVGRNIQVLPVRALGKCGGWDSDIVPAMLWAAGINVPGVPPNLNPARVLNLSLGGDGACTSDYVDAIAQINAVGAVVVVAAGNGTGHALGAPANCPGVIAVTGLRHIGTKVGFSDLGPEISISAPGGNCVNTGATDPCLYPILTTSNRGSTVPVPDIANGSIYTDSFNASLGTSFSAPLVAGTAALMLSVRPALTAAGVRALMQSAARPFPTTGASNTDGTPVPQCTVPQPMGSTQIDQLECYCTTATCGAGMLDAGAAVRAALGGVAANYTGLFWNAPAGSESGWGINFSHQGDVIFATWFTYNASGKGWWLTMTANKAADGSFAGALYETHGPPFNAVPFNPAAVTSTAVGSGTLTFSDVNNGTFAYIVNGTQQSKTITRQAFAAPPTCVFGVSSNPAAATNYQGLWWDSPVAAESGWGINFTHQGDTIFATWFTYDTDGTPMWLSATAPKIATNTYGGTLYRSTGPAFSAVPFLPANVVLTPVGTLTLTFADGNTATFAYTVNGVSQTKTITRQVFRTPGTVCQ